MKNRLVKAIEKLEAEIMRPRYIRVVAALLVHARRAAPDNDHPCPCCLNPNAEIVERRQVADVVIDTHTGRRVEEADVPVTAWAEYCVLAKRHDVSLRCSTTTLPLMLDDSGRDFFASGGNRAAKTTTGLYWFALQIIRRGGQQRRFWLIATTDEKSFGLLEKLLKPTPALTEDGARVGLVPAILPAALVLRSPETYRASDKRTRLIDGTIIDQRSFHGDPGASRAKADPIIAGLVDEAAHLPSDAWMSALRGRCLDHRGRLWLASTATPSSILNGLVEKCLEYQSLQRDDPRLLSGTHEGAAWIFRAFPMRDNPWVSLASIEDKTRTLDMTKPENRRDFLGEWVSNEGRCWTDFTEDHVVAHEARSVGKLSPRVLAEHHAAGHVDITERVSRMLFARANPTVRMAKATNGRWIIGQDVNLSPMSSALMQVTAPSDKLSDRDAWHYWIVDTVSTATSNSLAHAERLVSAELARVLDPEGSGSPLAGCGVIMDATAIRVDPTARAHGQSGSAAETFWRAGLDARAPAYRRSGPQQKLVGYNPEVLHRFTLLHRVIREGRLHVFNRCGDLLRAFEQQLVMPDGIVPLDARRGKWDQIMGPMDAASYAVYAAANAPAPAVAVAWSELPSGPDATR